MPCSTCSGGSEPEGRDTGTVVFPGAEAKFFLTADPAVRGRRRWDELRAAGAAVALDDTVKEMQERDERDSNRAVAPLRPADDAVPVDSSDKSLEEVVAVMIAVVRDREQQAG
jgi:CMP/dCMP kinase